jgi:hypothetical protein
MSSRLENSFAEGLQPKVKRMARFDIRYPSPTSPTSRLSHVPGGCSVTAD